MNGIKITSDGTVSGTRIIDAETGKDIPGAYAFELRGSATKTTVDAVIYCHIVQADVATLATVKVHRRPSLWRRLKNWWQVRRARRGLSVQCLGTGGWAEWSDRAI